MLIHNLKVELVDNDKVIKLTQLLNELNIKFTVDNLSKVLEIMFMLYIEPMDIDKTIKLLENLGYTDIFENQDMSNAVRILEKLMFDITYNQEIEGFLGVIDKLKYEDILDIIYQASVKLYEKLKVEMVQEDFNIYVAGGLIISAMRPMIDLKSLTMGSMKTMTLWNFYFKDN